MEKTTWILFLHMSILSCKGSLAMQGTAFTCQEPLGMSTGVIKEGQLKASSTDGDNVINWARLFGDRSWRAGNNNPKQWITLDFQGNVTVTGLATQGRPTSNNNYVTRFTVAYSVNDMADWSNAAMATDSLNRTEFEGNSNRYTPVFNAFSTAINLRHIRINTVACQGRCAMRIEFFGCRAGLDQTSSCQEQLGMANGLIKEGQLVGSSTSGGNVINRARLFCDISWRPGSGTNQWLTVDFKENVWVSGLATQGRPQNDNYVKKYRVAYSVNDQVHDNDDWSTITIATDSMDQTEFEGNTDRFTPVFNAFLNVTNLRHIRIDTVDCQSRCSMRIEFFGCRKGSDCNQPLGMSNGFIQRDQLNASSGNVDRARLYGDVAWIPNTNPAEWMMVDFRRNVIVSAVATQGNPLGDDIFVQAFKVSYSVTYDNLEYITDLNNDTMFQGNTNRYTPVFNKFSRNIETRYIRIAPVDCKNQCAMRVEFYGCRVKDSPVVVSPMTTATGSVESSSITPLMMNSRPQSSAIGSSSSTGSVAGSIIGVLLGLIAIAVVAFFVFRWRFKKVGTRINTGLHFDGPYGRVIKAIGLDSMLFFRDQPQHEHQAEHSEDVYQNIKDENTYANSEFIPGISDKSIILTQTATSNNDEKSQNGNCGKSQTAEEVDCSKPVSEELYQIVNDESTYSNPECHQIISDDSLKQTTPNFQDDTNSRNGGKHDVTKPISEDVYQVISDGDEDIYSNSECQNVNTDIENVYANTACNENSNELVEIYATSPTQNGDEARGPEFNIPDDTDNMYSNPRDSDVQNIDKTCSDEELYAVATDPDENREGWKVNSIYSSAENEQNEAGEPEDEGWEDNPIY